MKQIAISPHKLHAMGMAVPKRKTREDLERKLVEALGSGEATEMTHADWERIRSAYTSD